MSKDKMPFFSRTCAFCLPFDTGLTQQAESWHCTSLQEPVCHLQTSSSDFGGSFISLPSMRNDARCLFPALISQPGLCADKKMGHPLWQRCLWRGSSFSTADTAARHFAGCCWLKPAGCTPRPLTAACGNGSV